MPVPGHHPRYSGNFKSGTACLCSDNWYLPGKPNFFFFFNEFHENCKAHFPQLNHWSIFKKWKRFPSMTEREISRKWKMAFLLMAGEVLIFPIVVAILCLLFHLPWHSGVSNFPTQWPCLRTMWTYALPISFSFCPLLVLWSFRRLSSIWFLLRASGS